MTKVTYIISDIDKALAFEWLVMGINKKKIALDFILLNPSNSYLEKYLKENGVSVKRITLYSGWKLVLTFIHLFFYLLFHRSKIIHTHLRYASLLGITAAWILRIPERIHTRHHSTFHFIYHPHAVKQDKWVNRLSTKIIAISPVVQKVLIEQEGVPTQKVILIPHGFDLETFRQRDTSAIDKLSKRYNPENRFPVIGVISRYIELKGLNFAIDAFKILLNDFPNALLVLANAKGPDLEKVKSHLSHLKLGSFIEIEFEKELPSLYQLFDVFVHVPIAEDFEAFGQIYVEALAAGIPSVFTMSGIAPDFINDKENALVVDYKNSEMIYLAIKKIVNDSQLAVNLRESGLKSVRKFDIHTHINKLESLYLSGVV